MDIDICFAVDQTGSMASFTKSASDTLKAIVEGETSVAKKLQAQFPDIAFTVRFALMGYRDLDDKGDQFKVNIWSKSAHFTQDPRKVISAIDKTLSNPSGGADIAEDHLGAIQHCCTWNLPSDWTSEIKFLMLLTDAPAHGMVPAAFKGTPNADDYGVLHPNSLTCNGVAKILIDRDIDLFFCSFNPQATATTESELSKHLFSHPENTARREVVGIPLVDATKHFAGNSLTGSYGKHMVFVLDESGSMAGDWSGVVKAYNEYLNKRKQNQCGSDLVSVVQFDSTARTTVRLEELSRVRTDLEYAGGGTFFNPAAKSAMDIVNATPLTHVPAVIFMSDGAAGDAAEAAISFSSINRSVQSRFADNLELHVIAFGDGANISQLQQIANASTRGKTYTSGSTAELYNIFVSIAGGRDVTQVLQAEVTKRISDSVADRLSIEYLALS
ncbi:hypothetical protein ACA910_001244 [Epithemia clementina (nom. ined.)]